MANLVALGENFYNSKMVAKNFPEAKELKAQKTQYKEAFMTYLNWGGKYEVQPVEVKTAENKAQRKMNEWVHKKERMDASAPLLTRLMTIFWNFFTSISSCFYVPSFEQAQRSFEACYMQTEQSFTEGAQAVRAARLAKHAFKDAFNAASPEEKEAFFNTVAAVKAKAEYWQSKA